MKSTATSYQGVVLKLIFANVIFFVFQNISGNHYHSLILQYFALTPIIVVQKLYIWQLVSYMFLHGSFMHIFFNMYALLIFGIPIEQEWGSKKFLTYYFFTGIGAGITIFLINLISTGPGYIYPTIGASGAVFGLLLAFGILYPNAELLIFFVLPVKAKYLVVMYGAIELYLELSGGASSISHLGHLGGLLFGIVYFLVFKKKSISFKRKIVQSKMMKNFGKHNKALSERSGEKDQKNTERKVAILKKLEQAGRDSLTDDEVQLINYMRIMNDSPGGTLCSDHDFNEDDNHCTDCEHFNECFLRRTEKYFQ